MLYRVGAELVVVLHLAFIVFAVAGAVLVAWRGWAVSLHLPALAWGAWIELSHGVCPLTPLENALRERAGSAGYPQGFIEHYLIPLIYPAGLLPQHQLWLAAALLAPNLLVYGWMLRRYLAARRQPASTFQEPNS